MDGRAKIAETIFYLKNLTLRSGQDSTEILENEDQEDSQRISKSNKKSSALKIAFGLVLFCCLVGIVSVEIQTRNLLRGYQDRIQSLERNVQGNRETSDKKYKDIRILQDKLSDVTKGAEDFEEKIENDLEDVKKISSSQLKTFLEESNTTLCNFDKDAIHFPVEGSYKLFVSLLVKGHVYAEEQIATLKLNNAAITGGVVKVTKEEAANDKSDGKCDGFAEQEKCFRIKHAMLLRVNRGDVITLDKNERNTGLIVKKKMCIRYSEISLPDNITSTVITH